MSSLYDFTPDSSEDFIIFISGGSRIDFVLLYVIAVF